MAKTDMQKPACGNTFLIGAQKSGTTYLASLLDQCVDVCVSNPKEPQFFSSKFDDGFDAYGKCFSNPGAKIRLDASTTYSFLRPRPAMDIPDAPGLLHPVPQRIKDACPEARFIYIMRNPVKRAMSAVRHNARTKSLPDKRLSLVHSLREDPMTELISRYADQIERYLEVFPKERFLFLDFNDLKKDPEATVRQTCKFLGISSAAFVLDETRGEKHQAFEYTGIGRIAQKLLAPGSAQVRMLKTLIPKPLRQRLLTRPSEIEFYDIEEADALFRADLDRVQVLTGLTIR